MPSVIRLIGGAGTGKTSELLRLMQLAAEAGDYSPFEIGFVSFTRAARLEAAERAASVFPGVTADELQQFGWFRTLHSCCFQLLNVKQDNALTDKSADRSWLSEAIGQQVSGIEDSGENPFAGKTEADRVLSLWSTARNKLCAFKDVHDVAVACDTRTPNLSFCRDVIEKYEQAKRLDGRYDFTDLIGRYAGRSFAFDGPKEAWAEGDVPNVPVWFLDEQQDTSALLDLVCKRLVSNARWVYLSLDPFQSVYGWAGASYKHAMAWDVQREVVMPQSFRCPAVVSELGEKCLRRCSDYWDRNIKPAAHDGAVEFISNEESWTKFINPNESWLLLSRTNLGAQRLVKRIGPQNIPWVPTSGGTNTWNAPVRKKIFEALMNLVMGGAVSIPQWKLILKEVKGSEYIVRGTKKAFADRADTGELKFVHELGDWGATPLLVEKIKSDKWHSLLNHAVEFQRACDQWGLPAVFDPSVRVGTVHSAKGAQADNVILFTTTSEQINRGLKFQEIADEEHRLAYVGVTRAKKRLIIVDEKDALYKMGVS